MPLLIKRHRRSRSHLVYENGNHSTYQDDECDSSSHARKISLDEDILPTPTMTVDEDDDEPGKPEPAEERGRKKTQARERETERKSSIYNEY